MNIRNKQGMAINIKFILILLVVALLIYFSIGNTGSLVLRTYDNTATLPPETGTFNLMGYTGNYETVKLGCISAGKGTYYINGVDEGLSFCNSIYDGNSLKLYSKNTIAGTQDGGTNYIEAKIILPAGKGIANYDYSVSDYYPDTSSIVFKIVDKSFTFRPANTGGKGHSISGTGFYEFELIKETEVTFRIETNTQRKNENSEGNLEIYFTPNIEPAILPGQTDNSTIKLTIIERIKLFFSDLFSKLFGGIK
jgi:hypothetical protein